MKRSCTILLLIVCQYATAWPLFPEPHIRNKRDVKLDDEFKEIRERIVKIVGNVTKYSGKVQNGISKLDVEKNKLSGETSDAVVKQKQLTDERHSLEKQLGSAKQEAVVVDQQIAQADNQIAKESQDVRNAQNELDSIRRQRPKWHCIWRCRKKWKRAQRGRIEAAENVLAAARQRESNAIKAKNDAVSRRGTVRDRISRTEQALAQNKQKYEQLKATLLKRTNLTETILQLLKDLTSLQVNVIHLRQELQARQELDNEDLGVGWESINTPLNAISNYLNNGGFVKDLAGWGIDIKGFDVQSIRSLGIDIDEKTAQLLGIKSQ